MILSSHLSPTRQHHQCRMFQAGTQVPHLFSQRILGLLLLPHPSLQKNPDLPQIDQQRPDTEDGFLMITDILDQAQLFNAKFALDRTQPIHGLVSHHQSHELVFTLADGVNKVFQQKCTAILIMKDMLVMIHACKEDGTCFVFDSHARGNNGLPAATGKVS
ncbi:hypothetical protein PoB_005064800 [Plakobranchus ocellatus]|uniref:Uncharacterized protein n=1 Tax=Plakobranchus ocellatus TaxID=259542 RepID=A0AAV4BWX5_9GAST|nr:hypothetical protein PoB_005064800 [Plakobranchus ocellatus]